MLMFDIFMSLKKLHTRKYLRIKHEETGDEFQSHARGKKHLI